MFCEQQNRCKFRELFAANNRNVGGGGEGPFCEICTDRKVHNGVRAAKEIKQKKNHGHFARCRAKRIGKTQVRHAGTRWLPPIPCLDMVVEPTDNRRRTIQVKGVDQLHFPHCGLFVSRGRISRQVYESITNSSTILGIRFLLSHPQNNTHV